VPLARESSHSYSWFFFPRLQGNIFYDPITDRAFIDSLKSSLKKAIVVKEIDAHINDEEFADIVASEFLDIIKGR